MTLKKKLIISFCSLLIVLNLVNCIFFDGSMFSCFANILVMIFSITGLLNQNKEKQ